MEEGEYLVREGGIEPPRAFAHKILSLARLPISPLPQRSSHGLVALAPPQVKMLCDGSQGTSVLL
jgi:hypothetical protein